MSTFSDDLVRNNRPIQHISRKIITVSAGIWYFSSCAILFAILVIMGVFAYIEYYYYLYYLILPELIYNIGLTWNYKIPYTARNFEFNSLVGAYLSAVFVGFMSNTNLNLNDYVQVWFFLGIIFVFVWQSYLASICNIQQVKVLGFYYSALSMDYLFRIKASMPNEEILELADTDFKFVPYLSATTNKDKNDIVREWILFKNRQNLLDPITLSQDNDQTLLISTENKTENKEFIKLKEQIKSFETKIIEIKKMKIKSTELDNYKTYNSNNHCDLKYVLAFCQNIYFGYDILQRQSTAINTLIESLITFTGD